MYAGSVVEICTSAAALLIMLMIAGIFLLLAVSSYRLTFHPLACIPGPKLAAISNLWHARHVRDGRSRELGKCLHSRYGPVVRVGPNEVWVDSVEGFKKIYSPTNGLQKADFYLATALNKPRIDWQLKAHFPDTLDLLSESDLQRYKRQRRLIGPVYSAANLKKFEPMLDKVVKAAISEIGKLGGAELDLKEWMHMITVECLGAVVLSWSPGYLASHSDGGTSTQSYLAWKRKSVFGLFPGITKLSFVFKGLGRRFSNAWGLTFKTPKGFKPFFTPVYQKTSRRITAALQQDRQHNKTDAPKDLLSDLIALHEKRQGFSEVYLRRLAITNFGAGHETMCSALTAAMAMIGSHPDAQRKVAQEVRSQLPNSSLNYTVASIKEAQRLHPVISMSLPRKVPSGGLELDKYFLPAGTVLGCNPVALHRNPHIFGSDADEYKPERWLRVDEPNKIWEMERTSLTWGGGSRTCPGRHLAELVLQKVVTGLLEEFNIDITVFPNECNMPCYFLAMLTGVKARFIPKKLTPKGVRNAST